MMQVIPNTYRPIVTSTPAEFTAYLRGYMELDGDLPSEAQWQLIKTRLLECYSAPAAAPSAYTMPSVTWGGTIEENGSITIHSPGGQMGQTQYLNVPSSFPTDPRYPAFRLSGDIAMGILQQIQWTGDTHYVTPLPGYHSHEIAKAIPAPFNMRVLNIAYVNGEGYGWCLSGSSGSWSRFRAVSGYIATDLVTTGGPTWPPMQFRGSDMISGNPQLDHVYYT